MVELGESALENLPDLNDPEQLERLEADEEEEPEPEQTLEEKLDELVRNLLHKTPTVAMKAMKDVELIVAGGDYVPQLVESADQLVKTIREEFDGQLDMEEYTKNQLVNFLLIRFKEERVNMKRAAISTIQALFLHLRDPAIVNACAEQLSLKCRDPALAIRKHAAMTLTQLLKGAPEFERLRTTWLHAVMQLIVDREPGVQQHASKQILDVLIEPIVRGSDEDNGLVWQLLATIEEEADLRRLLLRTLVHLHKEKCLPQRLVKVLLEKATKHPELANSCWMLLSELSAFFDVSPNAAIEHWSERLHPLQPNRLIGYISKLIANRADMLSMKQRNFLKDNLKEVLMQYRIHPTYVASVYYMFARVMKGIGGVSAPGHKELEQFNQRWFGHSLKELDRMVYATEKERHSLLEELERDIKMARGDNSEENQQPGDELFNNDMEQNAGATQLHSTTRNRSPAAAMRSPGMAMMRSPSLAGGVSSYQPQQQLHKNTNGTEGINHNVELTGTLRENCDKLIRLITSIGECMQYTPALINKHIFQLLKVIIAADVLQKVYQEQIEAGTTVAPSRLMSPNSSMSFQTELPAAYPPPPGRAQSVVPSQLGGSPPQTVYTAGGGINFAIRIKKRVFRSELMTRGVRANAVITLGKLCLLDEQLAKKCIPVFVRELKQNSDHFIRNNIVVVVCDLCIRYTSMVDRYSTILASCLRDPSILIRRQTLMLLTNLIKEQYLKWEGPIIYRFVTTLLDSDKCIQAYANFCLTDILMPQFRERMFFHHFLECVFMFNDVRHASWMPRMDDFELNAEVDRQCSLEGRNKLEQRMELYKYMLNTFEDSQKVSILEKIGLEIFVPIVEGGMRLNDMKVRSLLFDAFKLMCTPEMKLKMQLGTLDVNYEGDDEEPPELVKTAAKKFISATFRKSIAESVMPHLFSLNSYLKEKGSPFARHCYTVILEMCHDHEEQLDDFLTSDPRLKAEIRLDLKHLQQQRRRAGTQRAGAAGASRAGTRANTPRVGIPRANTPRAAAPRAETPQAAAPRAVTPQTAATPRAATPRAVTPPAETPRALTPRAATPRTNTPRGRANTPRGRANTPRAVSPRAVTPRTNTPRTAATPRAVTPRAVTPRAVTPRTAATPRAETPRAATPRAANTPRAKTPRAATPRASNSN